MPTRSQELAVSISDFDASALDPLAVAKAKLCLLDFIGCAFESIELPSSVQSRAVASAGTACHILASARMSTLGDAAFANAVTGHGLVREDMHAGSVCHHGVVVWPALLALCETRRVTGMQFICAAVIAYEVGCRLGRLLIDADVASLYRPTGLIGPIAAAAGAGWMIGLDRDATASAIAIAANTSSGLNQWPSSGGSDMFFHPGFAAKNALTAVELAEAGAFGSPDILEGKAGLFAAFGRRAIQAPIQFFPNGEADILNVYYKAAPACNFAQTACQAALQIANSLTPASAPIQAIRIEVPRAAATYPGCDSMGPFERLLQAKMSIPFGVAAVLVNDGLTEANYGSLGDSRILKLVSRTELCVSDQHTAAFPRLQGATVEVRLADGIRSSVTLRDVAPATGTQVKARFREAVSLVLDPSRAEAIERFIDGIEYERDAGALAALCSKAETENGAAQSG